MSLRKSLLLLFIIISGVYVSGQENLSLKTDRSSGRTAGEFWKAVKERCSTSLTGGYQRVDFFNTLYYGNVENEVIKDKGGFWIAYSIHAAPVMFDASYFRSSFGVESDGFYPDYSEKSTYLHGVAAFISFAPLTPDFGKFSEIVQPYIGVGYQSSSLRVTTPKNESESEVVGSKGTSGMVWKGGVKLHLGKFCIRGEYHQSLSVTKPEAFSLIQIGAGIGF